jgi:4-hydroxy-tetrahydrodipicolinate synthase
MTPLFRGIFTRLITPVRETDDPDLPSLERLVRFQLESGVHGLWAAGTTAEFAGFDEDERAAMVETVIQTAGGRVPVVANVSDVSTRLTVRHARQAMRAGANAIAATPPFYYPHSQDELLGHYRAIRAAVDLPLYIYNIPQTVRVRVEQSTARQLVAEGTVAGIKDSQNDLEWFRQLTLFARGRGLPFSPFIGTRSLIDAGVLAGAVGAIPSMANIFPDLCITAFEAAVAGDFARSAEAEARIIEIESGASLLAEGSRNAAILALLKTVLWQRGIIAHPRLTSPLRTPNAAERETLLHHVDGLLPTVSTSR